MSALLIWPENSSYQGTVLFVTRADLTCWFCGEHTVLPVSLSLFLSLFLSLWWSVVYPPVSLADLSLCLSVFPLSVFFSACVLYICLYSYLSSCPVPLPVSLLLSSSLFLFLFLSVFPLSFSSFCLSLLLFSLCFCLSVAPPVCFCTYFCVSLSAFLPVSLPVLLFLCLSLGPSSCLSDCPPVCFSACLFVSLPSFYPATLSLCLSRCQVLADEVCGCPLVKDVFEPTGEFCRVSKRKCNKHYCWEKLRRAEVDLERVRVVTTRWTNVADITVVTGVQNVTLSLCLCLSVSLSVVQAGRAVWAGEEPEDGHDQSSRFIGSDAAPDHPARPNHNWPALWQGQIDRQTGSGCQQRQEDGWI